jgi:hypothetical protein
MAYKHEEYTAAIKKAAKLLDDKSLKGPAQIELERLLAQSETSPPTKDEISMIKQLDELVREEKHYITQLALWGKNLELRGALVEKYKALTHEAIDPSLAALTIAQGFTNKILNALGSGRSAGK